ncbi:MAG TPA: farnesyl diphosphate synthase [Tepidisphaeraceae bacterium]|nr:farnesyl diphosphate synthase [Tepidisphaeraceae bacterium]
MNDAISILERHGRRVGEELTRFFAEYRSAPPKLMEAIQYSVLNGGKRLRPTLVLECNQACGLREPNSSALAAAGAIELIHTFSLVHDDLPAMDDDDLRRGKPTCHKVFGEAMAILAGDAMVTMAFELLAIKSTPQLAPKLIAELAYATGPVGMIGGQVLDMVAENQNLTLDQLQQVHRLKTGALLTTSCRLGAMSAGADEVKLSAITEFGRHLGLAFQIIDDILDVTSTPQQLGKATNKDQGRGKNTYLGLLGLDASRAEAKKQLDAALSALRIFDGNADGLKTLAKFVVERQM